jgi:hypothetical protein
MRLPAVGKENSHADLLGSLFKELDHDFSFGKGLKGLGLILLVQISLLHNFSPFLFGLIVGKS